MELAGSVGCGPLHPSSRGFYPFVDDVLAAGLGENGSQVESPVLTRARPDEFVLEAHLRRALQQEVAHRFLDVTAVVAVSCRMEVPFLQLCVEEAVSQPESGDGDFLLPVDVGVLPV